MWAAARTQILYLLMSLYFFLLSDVINVKNEYDVKRSALEKICWDENVQLKCLHDLSAFLCAVYFCLLWIAYI